ncbi:unnamed protein product [Prunus brigantina]
MLEHRLNVRLGCFNQSLQSSITILKIANFYLMPNKPNLMTILLKNPKLVETKKMEACQLVQRELQAAENFSFDPKLDRAE